LATNGTFDTAGLKDLNVKQGSFTNRSVFFPESNDPNDEFLHIYGNPQDIQKALSQLGVCSN
jgi:hypothetical protein